MLPSLCEGASCGGEGLVWGQCHFKEGFGGESFILKVGRLVEDGQSPLVEDICCQVSVTKSDAALS